MAINKAFVVKNGFEASTDLIVADANTRRVGVGTTVAIHTLHVNGGIGATTIVVSGIGTFTNELNVGFYSSWNWWFCWYWINTSFISFRCTSSSFHWTDGTTCFW
jgi:hypothetical protein